MKLCATRNFVPSDITDPVSIYSTLINGLRSSWKNDRTLLFTVTTSLYLPLNLRMTNVRKAFHPVHQEEWSVFIIVILSTQLVSLYLERVLILFLPSQMNNTSIDCAILMFLKSSSVWTFHRIRFTVATNNICTVFNKSYVPNPKLKVLKALKCTPLHEETLRAYFRMYLVPYDICHHVQME